VSITNLTFEGCGLQWWTFKTLKRNSNGESSKNPQKIFAIVFMNSNVFHQVRVSWTEPIRKIENEMQKPEQPREILSFHW
jgi:hypothetical protein